MKKKQYIAPETVVIDVDCEGQFMREYSWVIGSATAISIKDGHPKDPSVHFAKGNNSVWDEQFEDANDDLDDKW